MPRNGIEGNPRMNRLHRHLHRVESTLQGMFSLQWSMAMLLPLVVVEQGDIPAPMDILLRAHLKALTILLLMSQKPKT